MNIVLGLLKGSAISGFGWATAYMIYIMIYGADAKNPMNLITLIILVVGFVSFTVRDFLLEGKLLAGKDAEVPRRVPSDH